MGESDTYPGDSKYWTILQSIRNGVKNDAITLRRRKDKPSTAAQEHEQFEVYSRDELATKLTASHNLKRDLSKPAAGFVGTGITTNEIKSALQSPSGYDAADEWLAWTGIHRGYWYDTYNGTRDSMKDAWFRPETESSSRFSADTLHQDAHFYEGGTVDRTGWNESNSAVDYVWGWDPKNWDPTKHGYDAGYVGTHVGYPFSKGDASCIVWITPQTAFFEVIKPHPDRPRRLRTSVTPHGWDWGYGQWSVKLRDGMLTPGGGKK